MPDCPGERFCLIRTAPTRSRGGRGRPRNDIDGERIDERADRRSRPLQRRAVAPEFQCCDKCLASVVIAQRCGTPDTRTERERRADRAKRRCA